MEGRIFAPQPDPLEYELHLWWSVRVESDVEMMQNTQKRACGRWCKIQTNRPEIIVTPIFKSHVSAGLGCFTPLLTGAAYLSSPHFSLAASARRVRAELSQRSSSAVSEDHDSGEVLPRICNSIIMTHTVYVKLGVILAQPLFPCTHTWASVNSAKLQQPMSNNLCEAPIFPEIRNGARAHQLPFFGSKKNLWKLFKKMRKKSCTYPTMFRTIVKNFAPKYHRMRPGIGRASCSERVYVLV